MRWDLKVHILINYLTFWVLKYGVLYFVMHLVLYLPLGGIVIDSKYNSLYLHMFITYHGLITISNVINSLAYTFYMTNFSTFVTFANKTIRKTL